MNFKEAYKSATDEIHGDKALLHAILNGEGESKKRFGFSLRPVYSVAVAASLVITCTALYFKNGFEDHSTTSHDATVYQSQNMSPDATASQREPGAVYDSQLPPKEDADTQSEQSPEAKQSTADSAKSGSPDANRANAHKPYDDTFSASESTVSGSQPTPASDTDDASKNSAHPGSTDSATALLPADEVQDGWQEASNVPAAMPPQAQQPASDDEAESENAKSVIPRVASGGGGGGASQSISKSSGGASAASMAPSAQTVSIGIDRYWEHIGLNVGSAARLPADMKLTIPSSVTVTKVNGEITQDALTLTAVSSIDSSRTVAVTVSKNSGSGNLMVSVSANNLNEQEINDLKNSLNY